MAKIPEGSEESFLDSIASVSYMFQLFRQRFASAERTNRLNGLGREPVAVSAPVDAIQSRSNRPRRPFRRLCRRQSCSRKHPHRCGVLSRTAGWSLEKLRLALVGDRAKDQQVPSHSKFVGFRRSAWNGQPGDPGQTFHAIALNAAPPAPADSVPQQDFPADREILPTHLPHPLPADLAVTSASQREQKTDGQESHGACRRLGARSRPDLPPHNLARAFRGPAAGWHLNALAASGDPALYRRVRCAARLRGWLVG